MKIKVVIEEVIIIIFRMLLLIFSTLMTSTVGLTYLYADGSRYEGQVGLLCFLFFSDPGPIIVYPNPLLEYQAGWHKVREPGNRVPR